MIPAGWISGCFDGDNGATSRNAKKPATNASEDGEHAEFVHFLGKDPANRALLVLQQYSSRNATHANR